MEGLWNTKEDESGAGLRAEWRPLTSEELTILVSQHLFFPVQEKEERLSVHLDSVLGNDEEIDGGRVV